MSNIILAGLWVGWLRAIFLVLGRLRQENCYELQISLGYIGGFREAYIEE